MIDYHFLKTFQFSTFLNVYRVRYGTRAYFYFYRDQNHARRDVRLVSFTFEIDSFVAILFKVKSLYYLDFAFLNFSTNKKNPVLSVILQSSDTQNQNFL